MAAPMKSAWPNNKNMEIVRRENAIKRRLNNANTANRIKATSEAAKESKLREKKKKGGTVIQSYTTQEILGKDKGYTRSDYGVGKGAAIPYQIGETKHTIIDPVKGKTPRWVSGRTNPPKPSEKDKARGIKNQIRSGAIVRRAVNNNVKGL